MEKKITDIFEYRDYRILLNDDFVVRTSEDPTYSLRAYARDISLSPSFLSDVLRGKKDLSPHKGKELFSMLGLSTEELEYVEHLIILRTTGDELLKRKSYAYIRQKSRYPVHANYESRLILKSLDHFFIYGVIEKQPNPETVCEVAQLIGISRERVQEVVRELLDGECLVEKNGEYWIKSPELVIPEKDQAFEMQRQLISRACGMMKDAGETDQSEAKAEILVLGFDESTQKLAIEAQSQLFRTLVKLSRQSTKADRVSLYQSSMLTLHTKL